MKMFLKSFRITQPLVLFIALILANLILIKLPLVGILGYEFSAVNAILLYLIGGVYIIHALLTEIQNELEFLRIWRFNKNHLLAFVVIPFLIGLVSSFFFSKCPLLEGILFYLVITVPAYLLGVTFAYYSFALSKKYSYLFFFISFIILICLPLNELFFNPQVYFYNPVIGYFPGTIYDEEIRIDRLLVAYRIFNLSFVVVILCLAQLVRQKKMLAKSFSLLIIVLVALTFSILKPLLFLSTDKESLNKRLHNTLSTDNFLIHYGNKSLFANRTNYVALLHEYYLDQIKNQLGVRFNHKIDSYVFQNREQKQELMGAGNANIAKPWLRQIYLNYSSYEVTLKHELVHIVASSFGTTVLKVADNFNSAMIEGLAVAIDDNYDGMPVHYLAKLAWQGGYRVSIPTLFSGVNFFAQTSSISYIYAGSFIKYLIEKYGVQVVKHLYQKTDFDKFCGKSLTGLSKEYFEFIKNYQIDYNKNQAQLYFGSKTIFKKYCPRFAATQTREAWKYFRRGEFYSALKLFRNIYGYSESYSSLIGIIRTLSTQKKYDEAGEYLKNEISKFNTDQNYFILELALGDLLIKTNKFTNASAEYDSLISQNPHIEYTNEVLIRQFILEQGVDSLKAFFNSSDTLKLTRLIRLNEKEIRYFSIPRSIQLAENTHRDISNFLIGLKKKFNAKNYESRYAAFQISRYFLKRMDLENAQIFAVKAVSANLSIDEKQIFVENLRMVNWFKNFSNEVKVN
ncbi:MAG: hypothetical protein M1495_15270 [Bacteroidetes bacterium]|nr:hypothetical protein [Bacteroidota bacterium]